MKVFSMLLHNTDVHLRNHGFLLGTEGWRLSPVYDINPQPWPGGLSLNADEVCFLGWRWSGVRTFFYKSQ